MTRQPPRRDPGYRGASSARGARTAPRQGAPRQGAPRQGAPRQGAPRQGAPRDPYRDPYRDAQRDVRRDPYRATQRDVRRDPHRDPRADVRRDPRRDPRADVRRDPRRDPRADARRSGAEPPRGSRQPSRQQPRGGSRGTPPPRRPVRSAGPARPARPARPPRRPRALRLGKLRSRLRWGLVAVCVLLLVIGGRLVQLQGLDHGNYANAAAAQRDNTITLHAMRGSILDRTGAKMAYTSDAQDITADPKQIKLEDRGRYAAALAPLLHKTEAQVITGISEPGQYSLLATALSPMRAQKVEALGLLGIYTQATTQRQYPGGTTGGNIIGTVHSDGTGAAGIEAQFNSLLAGHDGLLTYSVDNVGNVNPASRTTTDPARNGSTVQLTIDQNLQYTVQQAIDNAVPASRARGASVAVLSVKTGQVLALASSGTLDPSDPNSINPDVPSNPTVMSPFEPGSVQKGITFAAALEQHVIKPTTVLNVPYSIHMGGVKVSDAWYHPTEPFTATGVLAESSNVGTLQIAKKLGPSEWMKYEQRFGVGQKTGVELPGESAGVLPARKDWSDSTFANLPFGQGVSMTILQMASIYQTIANDGVRIPPRIVQSITSPGGSVERTQQPAGIRVIQPGTARTVRTMLESVTMPGGTGVKAAIPGYRVAGKTGTAQQPDPKTGRYSSYINWDTFAGMVPADDPQFVVAIMVDNPAHGLEGGDVAAPLFHTISTYEVQHARVAPTGSQSKHVPLMDCKGINPATLPANVC